MRSFSLKRMVVTVGRDVVQDGVSRARRDPRSAFLLRPGDDGLRPALEAERQQAPVGRDVLEQEVAGAAVDQPRDAVEVAAQIDIGASSFLVNQTSSPRGDQAIPAMSARAARQHAGMTGGVDHHQVPGVVVERRMIDERHLVSPR